MTGGNDEVGRWMKGLLRMSWPVRVLLVVLAFVVLFAFHGGLLYLVLSHLDVSGAVVFGSIALIVLKHVGLLGSAYAFLRRSRA